MPHFGHKQLIQTFNVVVTFIKWEDGVFLSNCQSLTHTQLTKLSKNYLNLQLKHKLAERIRPRFKLPSETQCTLINYYQNQYMQAMIKVRCPKGNLERASTVITEAKSHQCPANQWRLTVGGVAAKLSISSCVTQTFPVV